MDPWLSCQTNVTIPENTITKFEDNFTLTDINDKLPDSEQYIAILERKLRKIKNDPSVLAQLVEKRNACMQQLLCGVEQVYLEEEEIDLERPISNSQILRTIAPEKQALKQGEIVELIKYDQLQDDESESKVNKDPSENTCD